MSRKLKARVNFGVGALSQLIAWFRTLINAARNLDTTRSMRLPKAIVKSYWVNNLCVRMIKVWILRIGTVVIGQPLSTIIWTAFLGI